MLLLTSLYVLYVPRTSSNLEFPTSPAVADPSGVPESISLLASAASASSGDPPPSPPGSETYYYEPVVDFVPHTASITTSTPATATHISATATRTSPTATATRTSATATPTTTTQRDRPTKRRNTDEWCLDSELRAEMETLRELTNEARQARTRLDDCDTWGAMISNEMRLLTPDRRKAFKAQLNELVGRLYD